MGFRAILTLHLNLRRIGQLPHLPGNKIPSIRRVASFKMSLPCASVKATEYFFPAERDPHAGTMMAWPTRFSVGESDIDATRQEVASIATVISRYEPLHLFVLKDADNLDTAHTHFGANDKVFIHPITKLDSLWARDTGPLFVRSKNGGAVSGLVLNFNNWGKKFPPNGFVGEGGALEFDGEGTLLVTESSILNDNRNLGKNKQDIEEEFARLLGITKTIWLKGVKGHDVTDCHIDALARFVSPGLVVLTRPTASHPQAEKEVYEDVKRRLANETDSGGRKIRVIEISEPEYAQFEHQPVNSYLNYYVVNRAIIAPRFGDEKADREAKSVLEMLFPERVVEQVLLKQLPVQGGGIHCATQQILV